ncbi:MAG: hypothetical protein DRN88_05980 [Candidatus Hydrothermarchaeota archaeon]|nr:MAG: hypothetical protein DRN88_05980 [Candidatus Hydrothermarchaeota archaeon]
MDNITKNQPTFSLLISQKVSKILTQLQIITAAIIIAVIIIVALAGWGILGGLGSPTGSQHYLLILAGTVGVVALLAGIIIVEITDRQARRLQELEAAILKYRFSCLLTGTINLLAGILTVFAIFTIGAAGGLWLPETLMIILNATGMILAIPKFKDIRRLSSNIIPPCSPLGRSGKK